MLLAATCRPQDAAFHTRMTDLSTRYDFNEYAASVKIYAIKQ